MSNPYMLPDGNVQIAFSGGRTSAYMLHKILEVNGGIPDRAVVTFQNTSRERWIAKGIGRSPQKALFARRTMGNARLKAHHAPP